MSLCLYLLSLQGEASLFKAECSLSPGYKQMFVGVVHAMSVHLDDSDAYLNLRTTGIIFPSSPEHQNHLQIF